MGTFGVYTVVLTTALFIYYCVVITIDLLKKDGKSREDVEEFVAEDDDQDAPTPVTLVGGEIRFGEQPEEESDNDDVDDDADKDGEGSGEEDDEEGDSIFDAPEDETAFDDYDGSGELTEEQYRILNQQFQENMEPAEPENQFVYDSAAYHMMMGHPTTVRTKVARSYQVES